MSYPDNNPKTAAGAKKVPLHLIPPVAKYHLALALQDGARKYGPFNWRSEPISISTYIGAMGRHTDLFWDGEDVASDSLIKHIAHIMASCAIMLDAEACGMLIDDRPGNGHAAELHAAYSDNKSKPAGEIGN